MLCVCRYRTWLRWSAVGLVLLVVTLSGTRSAWLMMGFVLLMFWWHHVHGRRWLLMLKSGALIGVGVLLLWLTSTDFQQRVDRSLQLLQGEQSAIDFALADRLPIWHTAWNMYQAHPLNGVGPRAFRQVYAEYAEPGDVWVAQQGGGLHAHHWVLEIMAETGTIGMVLMLLMWVMMWRYVRGHFNQNQVWPYGVALLAAFLPVVSLYSLFSSFWSICLWWLLMLLFAGVKNASD
nr:O-antigen ligase family protein [Marinicella sp. NBU2979]